MSHCPTEEEGGAKASQLSPAALASASPPPAALSLSCVPTGLWCLLPEPAPISAAQHMLSDAGQTLGWAMNQTGPCPGAPGIRGQTVSLINKLNATLGRHVLQHDGERRVGLEPEAGQSCAAVESWEHYRSGLGEGKGREKALGQ